MMAPPSGYQHESQFYQPQVVRQKEKIVDNVFASDSEGGDNEEEEDSIFDKPLTSQINNISQTKGSATLKDFLSSIGLDSVYSKLVSQGYETVDDLEDLTED